MKLGRGLGMGMDLQWDDTAVISHDPDGRAHLSKRMKSFLSRYGRDFQYFFFSLQPNAFDLLLRPERLEPYFDLFDELFGELPNRECLALHHTFLNMGTLEREYPRELVVKFTNALIRRYGIQWVNEDLGVWSLKGKMLPYPLPPVLNQMGLDACVGNVRYYMEALECPLFVEFPGFSEGASFQIGRMKAFEFFAEVIARTGASCVLDTGHILSYQWLLGRRSGRFLEGLDSVLPFSQCREIHLSGCSIVGDKFVDFHHGVLLEEQLVLLDYLLERCPSLVGVTYEDPKFDLDGCLIAKSVSRFERLRARVADWRADERLRRVDIPLFA